MQSQHLCNLSLSSDVTQAVYLILKKKKKFSRQETLPLVPKGPTNPYLLRFSELCWGEDNWQLSLELCRSLL